MDIVKSEGNQLAASKARGFEENIEKEDLIIPRAKLLQALSPEIVDGIEGLKPGDIINSLTKEKLPEAFIPVFYFAQWIRFNPRDQQAPGYDASFGLGDIIYRTNNPHDERLESDGKWQGETPPLATKFMCFFSMFEGVDMPVITSFAKTSIKAGRSLLSLAKFSNADMWSKRYKLTAKKTQSDKGTYYVLDVALNGLTDEANLAKAEALYKSFREKDITVHVEDEQEKSEVPF